MPLGNHAFNVYSHSHVKADALSTMVTAIDNLVTGNAVFALVRNALVNSITEAIALVPEPLPNQEVYLAVSGNLESWDLANPDVVGGMKLNVAASVAQEL